MSLDIVVELHKLRVAVLSGQDQQYQGAVQRAGVRLIIKGHVQGGRCYRPESRGSIILHQSHDMHVSLLMIFNAISLQRGGALLSFLFYIGNDLVQCIQLSPLILCEYLIIIHILVHTNILQCVNSEWDGPDGIQHLGLFYISRCA